MTLSRKEVVLLNDREDLSNSVAEMIWGSCKIGSVAFRSRKGGGRIVMR